MPPSPAPLVLLIDDNADNREMYALKLTHSGFEVLQAEDGVEALALAAALLPSVAVTDLRMPGDVSAAEVCRHLRERDVPVIALTGVPPGDEHEDMWRAGCAVVLMKPLSPEMLITQIRDVLTPRASRP